MKYIKKYESKKYNVGDYVILNFDTDVKNFLEDNAPDYDYIGKIIAIEKRSHPIKIIFYNGYDFNILEKEILRLATAEEITDFESKINAKKYNL